MGSRALRVLVVDDCMDTAESLVLLLRHWGHEAHIAHDGRTALELAGAHRPDVVVLDLAMPGMDGFAVAARLRHQPALLVALTGLGQEPYRQRARDAGFDHHLVKPCDPEELRRLLAGHRPAPPPPG